MDARRNWDEVQTHVRTLADSLGLGELLIITGRDQITRSLTFENGTIVVSLSSNQERYKRIKQTA
jgi:hypothetical protein